jgi:hypothetical protein
MVRSEGSTGGACEARRIQMVAVSKTWDYLGRNRYSRDSVLYVCVCGACELPESIAHAEMQL